MERPSWAPEGIDIERPSPARMYDYILGGSHNFAIDRQLHDQVIALMPDLAPHARGSRAFMRRAVNFCVAAGMRQFLDLGSGIPTRGNVHEVVQRAAPEARVMYIDIDPVGPGPIQATLADDDRIGVIQADPRQPESILTNPQVHGLLDFDQPMAVLLGMLYAIPEEPTRIVTALRDAVAPGSYLAIFHLTAETRPEMGEMLQMAQHVGIAVRTCTRAEVERLFAGLELVEPGVVWAHEWRPDSSHGQTNDLDRPFILCGVGRKP